MPQESVFAQERRPESGSSETRRSFRAWVPLLITWLAGASAAAVSLTTGEMIASFTGARSLVLTVADLLVAEAPGGVVRWSIDTFGSGQKTVLVIGIIVASLIIGALLGWVSGMGAPSIGDLGFALFGLIGAMIALTAEDDLAVATAISSAISATVGAMILRFLLARVAIGPRTFASTSAPVISRREALPLAGRVLLWIAIGLPLSRRLGGDTGVQEARQALAERLSRARVARFAPAVTGTFDDVTGLAPYVTPNESFYRIDTALRTPEVEVADWRLRIHGMVTETVELTMDDLLVMPQEEHIITLSCVSNSVGGDLVGNATWSGVRLDDLLERVGVFPEASQIVGRSVDGWTAGFPTEVLDGRPALVALTMNGEPLPTEHGFPARLVVPGLYGYVSATKWLSEIELTTWDAFDSYWVPRGWAKEGVVKTQSRIDVPRASANLTAGQNTIAGVAWAPHRGITSVEARVDDGPWREVTLSDQITVNAWRQWKTVVALAPGSHTITVRAADGDGVFQTEQTGAPAPDGATGHHAIEVMVE